ncbi:hypothetical protein D6D21_03632 [Aureobasidium pullulans]|uniref:Uncharacterized protein n=1 Tax=Aureobasidium pullulans TaxID=5580 RepID=A0AB74J2I4_AURPU|nr:hypothetical protein D6D21_03632 [Aureobasidium pullulans]
MDAYNSSDDEDVIPPPPNPFANSGTRAIKNMLENAEEARKQSKVASRGLQLVYGAKGSQYLRQRAKNLFFAFYTGVLGHREDRFPTYEDFERFLLDIPHRLDGRHANGTVSESTVVSLQTDVLQVLEETFEGFKISKGNEARIKSVFYTLRQKGLITTTPSREMQWITSNVLFEMLQTTFRNAITTGTPSWSIVIAKALSLALVSATAARVGDVSRSHRYADDYVLKWADVTIKVSEDEVGRPVFRAKITLRHTKGHNGRILIDRYYAAIRAISITVKVTAHDLRRGTA